MWWSMTFRAKTVIQAIEQILISAPNMVPPSGTQYHIRLYTDETFPIVIRVKTLFKLWNQNICCFHTYNSDYNESMY
jgi:hypothetical protein